MTSTPRLEADNTGALGGAPCPSSPKSSPQYGQRLLIPLIDEIASATPSRAFTFIPRTSSATDGWKPLTYGELASSIQYWAHDVAKTTKGSIDEFPTVAYIGPNDVRYIIFLLACVRAGCKALFISPRNTTAVQLSLFEASRCNYIYYDESFDKAVQPCLGQRAMKATTVPPVSTWLASAAAPFPYSKTASQAQHDPLVVIHTSGSTGTPKPITIRQGTLLVADSYHSLPKFDGSAFTFCEWARRSTRMLMPMPLFHTAGILSVLSGVYYGIEMALPVAERPLNVDSVLEALAQAGVDSAILPPAVLEEMAKTEDGIQAAAALSFVAFGGGSLSSVAGDRLVERGAVLGNTIGSTEHFPYAAYFPRDARNWQYNVLNPSAMGITWRRHSSSALEMVIRRIANPTYAQPCFYTFPQLDEWSTQDLFQPHPTLPNYWRYQGRADDVIVFSTGEKLNPVTLEGIVASHGRVKGALVVGQGRFSAGLVLEPQGVEEDEGAFVDAVWPVVERANAETVAHGRIDKSLVVVARPDMAFCRAAKGTVQRAATVKLYEHVIDAMYKRAEERTEGQAVELDMSSPEALTQSMLHLFRTRLGVQGLEARTDFFAAGIDSLQIMTAAKLLKVPARAVYRHSTAEKLAAFLVAQQDHDEAASEVREMQDMLARLTADLPGPPADKPGPADDGQTVLITGTTGSLGAYMLDHLTRLSSVSRIVALNRGADGGSSRQPGVNASRGLTSHLSKVTFLSADLSLPRLGLSPQQYDALLASADRIIHNAWPVNFNMGIASFEPSVRGVRHLVDFAHAASKTVPIVFVSSIGTADGWTESRPVPEVRIEDLALPQMGYGRSKMLGSLVLDAAGLPAASVRVGQIAGPRGEAGVWNRQEFIPSLIASSVYLGVLPESLGPMGEVNWTPVEDISTLILDIAGLTTPQAMGDISGYFHGVNPSVVAWADLVSVLQDYYAGRITGVVSLREWVARLEASGGEDLSRNPGFKLLDTYRGFLAAEEAGHGALRFETERTREKSPAMRGVGPITGDMVRNWCRQWAF